MNAALAIIACILAASYIIVAVARKSRTDDLKIRRKGGKNQTA